MAECLQPQESTVMRFRQFVPKIIICAILQSHFGSAQVLKISEVEDDSIIRNNLVFESNRGDSILYFKGYSVIYSYTYNLPQYVFNIITVDQLISSVGRPAVKRRTTFMPYILPNGIQSATNEDYYKSGYDRGHMVPAGDFVWNKELKDETFYYVNINPQIPTLNRGVWANLESRIREKVLKYSESAYVVTGAIFNPEYREQIGPKGMCVPVAFFKIVYFEKREKMFAFMYDNTIENYFGNINDFQVTVDFLEKITEEDFFDLLNDDLEVKLESIIENFND